MQKQMSWPQFFVHMVVWVLVTLAMFRVWEFADDYRRVLVAPDISAIVNGLTALAWIVVIAIDCHFNSREIVRHWVIISLPVLRLLDRLDEALRRVVGWIARRFSRQ